MENDWNLSQIVDSQWRRETRRVAENDAISALLLENLDAKEVGVAFAVSDVDMERANISNSESA